jgi:hypothetical protein
MVGCEVWRWDVSEPKIFPSEERIAEMVEEGRKYIAERRALGPDPNSALIWFPAIRDAGLPVPRTEFVEFDPDMLWPICDGKPARDDFPMRQLENTCECVGYPVFIRTDLSSAKHDGPESFRADSPVDLWRCIVRTFEDNACKDLASFLRAWMVREWINIESSFTAFGGLAIGREWRLFANQEMVSCQHFYWPEEAFSDGYGVAAGWEPKLAALRERLNSSEGELLRNLASRAARAIGDGAWSVDFAFDTDGKPWLIDMARAESSWHPEHKP